jgi:hypothetical protein
MEIVDIDITGGTYTNADATLNALITERYVDMMTCMEKLNITQMLTHLYYNNCEYRCTIKNIL